MAAAIPRAESVESITAFLEECLEISPADLNDEFMKIPGQIAFWNERYATATYKHQTAKLHFERERARLFVALRNRPEPNTKKPPPMDAISALCDDDDDLFELAEEVARKDAERIKLKGICEAMLRKADMLQSIGAKLREEHRTDHSVRRQRAEERLLNGDADND
jgi:hypothetical protein